jgi:hypothetical protein
MNERNEKVNVMETQLHLHYKKKTRNKVSMEKRYME